MKFQVPIKKDLAFIQEFFTLISENISDLSQEYEKHPNKIIFTGRLGKELLDLIQEKECTITTFLMY